MADLHLLANNTPQATPATLENFEGRDWPLYPLDTLGIAAELERWVSQHVRANVERLRPADDCDDPLAWRVYNEDKAEAQKAVQRGDYGALMPGWYTVLCKWQGPGFAEALFQCVRWRAKDWTREHVKRLLADPVRYQAVWALFDELNFPKVPSPVSTGPNGEPGQNPTRSTGGDSLPDQQQEGSSQASSQT